MRKSLLKDLDKLLTILESKESKDKEELKRLSDHLVQDVAYYQNYDAATLAVLIYSLYKSNSCITTDHYKDINNNLISAKEGLKQKNYGRYNKKLKICFELIKHCNKNVKVHFNDIITAAKIKKSSKLLEQGLSIQRAASIMDIDRWELQQYLRQSSAIEKHSESSPAKARIKQAIKLFQKGNNPVLFLDAGPLITLTMAGLIQTLKKLKGYSNATFYITPSVIDEVITRPKQIKRFAFEVLQIKKLLRDNVIQIYTKKIPQTRVKKITNLANSAYSIKEGKIEILQAGEIETIVAARQENNKTVVIDERTLRLLLEKSTGMKKLLEIRKKKRVNVNRSVVDQFLIETGKPSIIRSSELVATAIHYNLRDEFLPTDETSKNHAKETLLNAALWNTKYNGSSILGHEIDEIVKALLS